MFTRLLLVLLLSAGLAAPVRAAPPPPPPREESERLRADMEGQAERLRLTVETFMAQQDRIIGDRLAGQDHRIDDMRQTVLTLAGLCAALATLAGALAVLLARGRRRPLEQFPLTRNLP